MSDLFISYPDGQRFRFSASTFEDLDKCPQYFKYRNIDRWSLKHGRISARWGTLVHSCLEVYDHALVLGADAQDAAVKHALQIGQELKESDDNARTRETLVRAVAWYGEQFKSDPYRTTVLPDGRAAVEVRFEVPIPGRDYTVSGRIDRIADNEGLWIIDRKTTKKTINEHYFGEYAPGGLQFPTYMWAANQMGLEPRGVLVETCQTMVNGCRWRRRSFEFPKANLAEFEADMLLLLDQADEYHRTGYWPRRRSGCNMHNGCSFREICNALPSQRERYLRDAFEQRPYVPK